MSDKIMIVSADGHAGPPPETTLAYIEPEFREAVTSLLMPENEMCQKIMPRRDSMPPELLDVVDVDHRIRSGGDRGGWDWSHRLAELDHDGVAGDVIDYGLNEWIAPFFSPQNNEYPPDLRMAGAKAYHRYLADGIVAGGGRFVGVAAPGPCHDMGATLAELDWVAAHGLTAVALPGQIVDPDLPPLHDAHFEPFWAKCSDLGLVLRVHAGWGMKQGILAEIVSTFFGQAQGEGDGSEADMAAMAKDAIQFLATDENSPLQLDWKPRSVLWQLMLGGVFDRYPAIQLVFTEMRADWVPVTLAHLDERFEKGDMAVRRRPSEYWDQHCWTVPSSPHTCEIEMRNEPGMNKMLFGTDYPHLEGTWPNTKDWIRHTFGGVAEPEARQILGERAADLFGFDGKVLTLVAERIGPAPSEVLGRFDLDPKLLDAFHRRAGMSRGPDPVDIRKIDSLLNDDLMALASAPGAPG